MAETTLRFATAPVNWNNDDIPGWREPVGFPDLLDRMAEAGYTATEYDDKIGPAPSEVGAAARERSIELCGFYQWVDLLDNDVLERQLPTIESKLRQLAALGCHHLIISDRLRPERDALAGRVPLDRSASLADDGYKVIADRANQLARISHSYGFATHYHNHVGTWIEAPFEVESLALQFRSGDVDFCFDTGHFAYGGGNSRQFIEQHLGSIGHLHLKDVDPIALASAKAASKSFRDALRDIVFAPLGAGNAEIAEIVAILDRKQFGGWIVIEQDTCIGDPTVTARTNLDFARSSIAVTRTPRPKQPINPSISHSSSNDRGKLANSFSKPSIWPELVMSAVRSR